MVTLALSLQSFEFCLGSAQFVLILTKNRLRLHLLEGQLGNESLGLGYGTRDVIGDAIALPELWYQQRSLCPKGLPMISHA